MQLVQHALGGRYVRAGRARRAFCRSHRRWHARTRRGRRGAAQAADDLLGVRVQQQPVRVEAPPWAIRAVDTQRVDQAGPGAAHQTVKLAVEDAFLRAVQAYPPRGPLARGVEQAQLNGRGMLRRDRHAHPFGADLSTGRALDGGLSPVIRWRRIVEQFV